MAEHAADDRVIEVRILFRLPNDLWKSYEKGKETALINILGHNKDDIYILWALMKKKIRALELTPTDRSKRDDDQNTLIKEVDMGNDIVATVDIGTNEIVKVTQNGQEVK